MKKLTKKEKLLIPQYRFGSVLDITADDIKNMSCKAIGLDIDNTVVPDGRYKYIEGINDWIDNMQKSGIPVIIISNGSRFRVSVIARHLGEIPYVHLAKKPSPNGLIKAAGILGVDITELAMIGDQLTSDIKAAKRCGAVAVRVDPLKHSLYPLYYKIKARQEEPYLAYFEKYIKK